MITLKQLMEDSQDAGYDTTLETPRALGPNDYIFVDINADRKQGSVVLDRNKKPIKGSKILKNNREFFQYMHKEGDKEIHIESVELYRDLWISIHVPADSL